MVNPFLAVGSVEAASRLLVWALVVALACALSPFHNRFSGETSTRWRGADRPGPVLALVGALLFLSQLLRALVSE